ncbi:hypothetical protein Tco_0112536, partial [Tanacetum coccineum]
NRPIFYDNDDDEYTIIYRKPIAIAPDLPIEEPDNSLSIGDEHLDIIPATESDEIIKSSVENLIPIPSEFKGISEDTCDVPVCEDPSTFDALNNHFEILSDYSTSSDDDSYENIEYVDATPPNSELVSLEEVEDVILHDKLSNVYLLISKIEALYLLFLIILLAIIRKKREVAIEPDQGGLNGVVISDNSNDPLLELPELKPFHFDLYDDSFFPCPPPEPPDIKNSLIVEIDAPVINNR